MHKQVKFSAQHYEIVETEETQDRKIGSGSVKVCRDNRNMNQSNKHEPFPKGSLKKVYPIDNMREYEDINFTSMKAAAEEELKYNVGQQYEAPSNSLRTIDGVMAEPIQLDGGLVPLPSALPAEGANTFANIFPSCSRGKQATEEPPTKKTKEEKPEEIIDITDKEQNDITKEQDIITEEQNNITEGQKDVTDEQNDVIEEHKDITDEQNDIAQQPKDITDEQNDIIEEQKDITDEQKILDEIRNEIIEIQETDKEILFNFDSESDFSLFESSESSIDDNDVSE